MPLSSPPNPPTPPPWLARLSTGNRAEGLYGLPPASPPEFTSKIMVYALSMPFVEDAWTLCMRFRQVVLYTELDFEFQMGEKLAVPMRWCWQCLFWGCVINNASLHLAISKCDSISGHGSELCYAKFSSSSLDTFNQQSGD